MGSVRDCGLGVGNISYEGGIERHHWGGGGGRPAVSVLFSVAVVACFPWQLIDGFATKVLCLDGDKYISRCLGVSSMH